MIILILAWVAPVWCVTRHGVCTSFLIVSDVAYTTLWRWQQPLATLGSEIAPELKWCNLSLFWCKACNWRSFTAPLRSSDKSQIAHFLLIFGLFALLGLWHWPCTSKLRLLVYEDGEMNYEVVMDSLYQAKTVAVKACVACSGGLLEYDKFCRWCGVRQTVSTIECGEAGATEAVRLNSNSSLPLTTSRLMAVEQSNLYRRVSGPLVSAVIAGVSANAPTQSRNRLISSAILALISVPIWLIIILLSPFDAIAAAKNLLRE